MHPLDHIDGGPDVAGPRRRLEEGGDMLECRLHALAADIVTNKVSRYTAYWRNASSSGLRS